MIDHEDYGPREERPIATAENIAFAVYIAFLAWLIFLFAWVR